MHPDRRFAGEPTSVITALAPFPAFISFTSLAPLGAGIAVAGDAVVDVADPFRLMLADQVRFLMFVATEAGELTEVICAGVAGATGNIMGAAQSKEPGVIDHRPGPSGLDMATAALQGIASVDRIHRRKVTVRTRSAR